MNLINVWVFAFFEILHNFVFVQKSLSTNNCLCKQNFENKVQGDIAFILNVLLETVNVFA